MIARTEVCVISSFSGCDEEVFDLQKLSVETSCICQNINIKSNRCTESSAFI